MDAPDLLAPSFYADIDGMHDTFRTLRAAGPVWHDDANDMWAVVHHDALIDVERRAEVFSSSGCYRSRIAPQEEDMIAKDDPANHEQRALVARRFTPKAVQRLEPVIAEVIEDLVDGFAERGAFDVVDDLAAPFPARLTAHLIGFGQERGPDVRSWSERLMRIDGILDDEALLMDMGGAIMEFAGLLPALAEERRAVPQDDLVSVWARWSSVGARWSSRSWCRRLASSSPAGRRRRAPSLRAA